MDANITVKELEDMIAHCFELKEEYAEATKTAKDINTKLEMQKDKCIAALTELELTSYKSKAGTFSFNIMESFKVPATPAARNKFFAFLQEKGVYEDMITVNSRILNSWAKVEIEASDELDFQIPGLVKSEPMFKASMRK